MHRQLRCSMIALFVAALAGSAATAHAAVITLTGGDSSDGWVAPASALFAYNLNGTSQTIQGVTFAHWGNAGGGAALTAPVNGAGITVITNTPNSSNYVAPVYLAPTANDTNMATMMSTIFYNSGVGGSGPLTFTMTGLVAGNSYQLDAFTYSDGASPRPTETFAINGTTTDTFAEVHQSYLVQNTVTAFNNGTSGEIDLSISGPGTPILSGLVLSAAAVPEPSSMVLLGAGSGLVALMVARRRNRKAIG